MVSQQSLVKVMLQLLTIESLLEPQLNQFHLLWNEDDEKKTYLVLLSNNSTNAGILLWLIVIMWLMFMVSG